MRIILVLFCLGLVAACSSTAPTVQTASGFDMCNDYQSSFSCNGKPYHMFSPSKGHVFKHEGMDFRTIAGAPVISASFGKVLSQNFFPCGGYKVTVESDVMLPGGKPLYVSYAHLKRDGGMIVNGAAVKPGDVIGHVAEVNRQDKCQGFSHVHFFVHTGAASATHTSPHPYWRDGDAIDGTAKFSCYDPDNIVPGKLTAPLRCKTPAVHAAI